MKNVLLSAIFYGFIIRCARRALLMFKKRASSDKRLQYETSLPFSTKMAGRNCRADALIYGGENNEQAARKLVVVQYFRTLLALYLARA